LQIEVYLADCAHLMHGVRMLYKGQTEGSK